MSVRLVRRPAPRVDATHPDAARSWLLGRVLEEVRTLGHPRPRIYLLGPDFVEWAEVLEMGEGAPDSHIGATFQAMRRRRNVVRCFTVLQFDATDPEGREHRVATAFEQLGTGFWAAWLPYDVDPATGLGCPVVPEWETAGGLAIDPLTLPPWAEELVDPPADAMAADLLDAAEVWQPDIKFTFGELAAEQEPPVDARQMAELAGGLAAKDLLEGALDGAVVIRVTDRSWEAWVLGGDQPADISEMIRWIANHRLPAAEGVALVQLAVPADLDPPQPGLQVLAEHGDARVQAWAPVVFPEGPEGPRTIPEVHWSGPATVTDEARWLGVPSKAPIVEPTFD